MFFLFSYVFIALRKECKICKELFISFNFLVKTNSDFPINRNRDVNCQTL